MLKNSIILGDIDTIIHGKRRILLQFKDNLKGVYYSNREVDDITVVQFVKPSTKFLSIPYEEYQLTFELFKTNETSHYSFKKNQLKLTVNF